MEDNTIQSAVSGEAQSKGHVIKGKINCDQVAWLLDIANRYIPNDSFPSISRNREMKTYGMLYEIMEVMGVGFEDENACHNGSPPDSRYIEPKSL